VIKKSLLGCLCSSGLCEWGRTEGSSWAALWDSRSRRVSGDLQDRVLFPKQPGSIQGVSGVFQLLHYLLCPTSVWYFVKLRDQELLFFLLLLFA